MLKRKIWKYRILGILYIPVHVLWHFFFDKIPNMIDPLELRLLLSGLVLLIVFASLFVRRVALHLEWLALLVSVLTNGFTFYLLQVNSFSTHLIIYHLFSVFVTSLIFESVLFLLLYYSANLFIILWGNWIIYPTEMFEVASWILAISMISVLNFLEKNYLNQKLKKKARMLHKKSIGFAESEKKYKTIAENVPGIVFSLEQVKDNDQMVPRLVAYGKKIYQFFSIPESEISTNNDSELFLLSQHIRSEDRPGFFSSMNESFEKKESWKWEGWVQYPSKNILNKYIQIIAHPMERIDGKMIWNGIILDQTEVKKALDDLEIQRMKNIYHEKMSALGQMSSSIAHEINNPLFIIDGKAHQILRLLTREDIQVKEIQEMVLVISRTSKRIAKIIKGLKTFSREGETDPFLTTPIRSIIDDTLEISRARIEKQGIELKVIFNPDLDVSKIECRASQIMQVLISLLNNAVDALGKGSGNWIEIQVERDGMEVLFIVADSGPGVPQDIQSKIMNPFFTTKAVGHGTGLGLSIALGIAKSHNGSLYLDRKYPPNRFILRLPISQNPKKSLKVS